MILRHRRTLAVAAPLLLLLAAAAPAHLNAQSERGQVEAGFDLAYVDVDQQGLSSGASAGARLGISVTRAWQIELDYDRIETEVDVPGGEDVSLDSIALAALFNFPHSSGKRVPFLRFGAGTVRENEDFLDAGSVEGIHLGGGLRFFPRPRFGVRFQVGFFSSGDDGDFGGAFGGDHIDFNTGIGLTWRLGGGSAAAPVEGSPSPSPAPGP